MPRIGLVFSSSAYSVCAVRVAGAPFESACRAAGGGCVRSVLAVRAYRRDSKGFTSSIRVKQRGSAVLPERRHRCVALTTSMSSNFGRSRPRAHLAGHRAHGWRCAVASGTSERSRPQRAQDWARNRDLGLSSGARARTRRACENDVTGSGGCHWSEARSIPRGDSIVTTADPIHALERGAR